MAANSRKYSANLGLMEKVMQSDMCAIIARNSLQQCQHQTMHEVSDHCADFICRAFARMCHSSGEWSSLGSSKVDCQQESES